MSSKRKAASPKVGKSKANSASPEKGDGELHEFLAWLRVSRRGGRLPEGCTPALKRAALEALAEMYGVKPIENPQTMVADFWPAEETADDIVAGIRSLRRHGK